MTDMLALFDPSPTASAGTATQPLRIYFIRHGETDWSLGGRHTGRTDVGLNAQGARQAQALAPGLQAVAFTQVWVSPMDRARETCRLAGLDGDAQKDPDLLEWDYGAYEGQLTSEVLQHRPDWTLQRDGCLGGESPAQVGARADRLIARLAALQGNVALFSHGQFGSVLAARWIKLPVEAARHLPLAPASVSVLGLDARHPGVAVIELWNAVAPDRADALFPVDTNDQAARRRAIERWENEGGEVPGVVAGMPVQRG